MPKVLSVLKSKNLPMLRRYNMNKIYNRTAVVLVSILLVMTIPSSVFSVVDMPPTWYSPYYPHNPSNRCWEDTDPECTNKCTTDAALCMVSATMGIMAGPLFLFIGYGICSLGEEICESYCEPDVVVPCGDATSPPSRYIK